MKRGIHAEVHSHSELNDTESVKTASDPLVPSGYCVNPQGEDDMSEKCDQREIGDFKEHRLLATEGSVRLGETGLM